MFCLYCGTNLPDDATFCNRCGKQQNVAEHQPSVDVPVFPSSAIPEIVTGNRQSSKSSRWRMIAIISTVVAVVIVISATIIVAKLATYPTATPQAAKIIANPTPTPENILCSGDASGNPMTSGKIDKSHPFHEDDGQAAQGDQGAFSPVTVCTHIPASSYAISFHAMTPYMFFYLYDSKHAKYEIDYDIYPDHISVVAYPGFSMANAISVGEGRYSIANWHTYRIEFRINSVRVLVDRTEVLSGAVGFTDDGSGDDLLLQSHQITMDQFSVTRI